MIRATPWSKNGCRECVCVCVTRIKHACMCHSLTHALCMRITHWCFDMISTCIVLALTPPAINRGE